MIKYLLKKDLQIIQQRKGNLPFQCNIYAAVDGISFDMSWTDCLIMGHQLFEMKAYNHTKVWMHESMKRIEEPDSSNWQLFSSDFLQEIAANLISIGELDAAFEILRRIMPSDFAHNKTNIIDIYKNSKKVIDDDENTSAIHSPYHVSLVVASSYLDMEFNHFNNRIQKNFIFMSKCVVVN